MMGDLMISLGVIAALWGAVRFLSGLSDAGHTIDRILGEELGDVDDG